MKCCHTTNGERGLGIKSITVIKLSLEMNLKLWERSRRLWKEVLNWKYDEGRGNWYEVRGTLRGVEGDPTVDVPWADSFYFVFLIFFLENSNI